MTANWITAHGFTLIELLVVVLIIGILAAVAVPQYQVAVAKSRYSQALVLVNDIVKAEEIYKLANGSWTEDLEKLSLEFPDYQSDKRSYFNEGYCQVSGTQQATCYMAKTASLTSFIDNGKRGYYCFFETDAKQASIFEKVCKNVCGTNSLNTWPGWDTAKRCKIS